MNRSFLPFSDEVFGLSRIVVIDTTSMKRTGKVRVPDGKGFFISVVCRGSSRDEKMVLKCLEYYVNSKENCKSHKNGFGHLPHY